MTETLQTLCVCVCARVCGVGEREIVCVCRAGKGCACVRVCMVGKWMCVYDACRCVWRGNMYVCRMCVCACGEERKCVCVCVCSCVRMVEKCVCMETVCSCV